MSLVNCLECGHQISTEANFCPNCGAKREYSIGKSASEAAGTKVVGFILFLIGLLFTILFYQLYEETMMLIGAMIGAYGLILLFKKTNVRK